MNIRNYVSNDHVMSVNEIATSQAQMIQLLTIEINDKDKEIGKLKQQLEAYENMRKEAIDYLKEFTFEPLLVNEDRKLFMYNENLKNFENILNKVGDSDE